MFLVDTSVWVDVFRDRTGRCRDVVARLVAGRHVVLSRFTQLELLQGAADEREWELLDGYLVSQDYLEAKDTTWSSAARVYFELRRRGHTVRSPIDCCIAQIAMDYEAILVHRDRDFTTVASISPLQEIYVDWSSDVGSE